MTNQKITPVILCGGSGTRLWPLSRKSFPKQFVPLIDNKSLLQLTLERVAHINGSGISSAAICVAAEDQGNRIDGHGLAVQSQRTYIPLGVKHRLENPGKTDLEMIEVQSGSYLGEDDIVRFEDTYGRVAEPSRRSG